MSAEVTTAPLPRFLFHRSTQRKLEVALSLDAADCRTRKSLFYGCNNHHCTNAALPFPPLSTAEAGSRAVVGCSLASSWRKLVLLSAEVTTARLLRFLLHRAKQRKLEVALSLDAAERRTRESLFCCLQRLPLVDCCASFSTAQVRQTLPTYLPWACPWSRTCRG